MMRQNAELLNINDYRNAARRQLPRMVFDFLEGGADDESALERNRAAFDAWALRPDRLVDVGTRDQSLTIFGRPLSTPLLIAPTGLNSVLWPDGDTALARAAAACGVPFVLSSASNITIEALARSVDGEHWFQLYVVTKTLADTLVRRALAADYSTLVLTVDVAVNGWRERDLRNGFAMPIAITPRTIADGLAHPRWLWRFLNTSKPRLVNFASDDAESAAAQASLLRRQMEARFNWDDLRRLRDMWPRTLIVKGILTENDAQRCVEAGVDSGSCRITAGGNWLISVRHSMSYRISVTQSPAHPFCSIQVSGAALTRLKPSHSARAVLIGRAVLYGLAARGETGVLDVINMFKRDIDRTLALIGCPALAKLERRHVAPRRPAVRCYCGSAIATSTS